MEKKRLIINGSYNDCIERIIHHREAIESNKIPLWLKTELYQLNEDDNKESFIELFKKCKNFYFQDDGITFESERSEEELEKVVSKYKNDSKISLKSNLNQLEKWFNMNEESKDQIETFLKAKDLDWILEEIDGSKFKDIEAENDISM